LARIVSYADHEVDPIDFCVAPSKSGQKALDKAGMKIQHIDYHEVNEAFACTVLANMKLLDLNPEKVNVHGGAVAMGHPIGVSGARVVLSLINVLRTRNAKYGMAGICNGGGGATSLIIERL
jgi:acetyl-CoA C-acetyltransferase